LKPVCPVVPRALFPPHHTSHHTRTHSLTHVQDGYTLERVNVYGLIDGVHETVVIPGAECYVGRNDNPSFSQSVSPCRAGLSSHFSILTQRFTPSKKKKNSLHALVSSTLQLVLSRSASFQIQFGMPRARRARTRYGFRYSWNARGGRLLCP
jgi:hypothetical protein